jgi:calcineurin-like phosphoesterase family protein
MNFNVIKINPDKKLVFVSDLHLNHDKEFLWGKRGFKSSEEHVQTIFNRLAKIADDDHVLINLGDATFRDPERKTFDRLAALPFHKHFHIWGNHPSGAKQAYRQELRALNVGLPEGTEVYPLDYRQLTFVGSQAFFCYKGQTIFANHFPQEIWDEMKHGVWHVCGHSHGSFDKTNGQSTMNGKIMDVGVEQAQKYNNGLPFLTFEQVKAFMDARAIIKKDHH